MTNKARILIVHNQYQLAGGEDTVAENEGNLLKANGHEVYYYIRTNKEIEKMNPVQKLLAGFGTFYSFKAYREISRLIKKHDIQIVHVHNTIPLISCSVYDAAKKNGCKIVQSIHNQRMLCPTGMMIRNEHICEDCVDKGLKCAVKYNCYRNSKLQSLLLSGAIAWNRKRGAYDLVDAYLVTTKFNYNMLSKVVPIDKIFYKPYYSDSEIWNLNDKKREYYIYISRVEYLKGIFVALKAFEKLPKQKLLVLGVGPGEEEAHRFVETHQLHNVEFLGFKSKQEMLKLLYHAKALVFPTQWYEGFPMTIVESMATGTPIIGSNIGNVGTIVKDGVNGLTFQYDNPNALKERINYFEKNPELARKLEEGAQREFIENHTFEKVYKITNDLYMSLLKNEDRNRACE